MKNARKEIKSGKDSRKEEACSVRHRRAGYGRGPRGPGTSFTLQMSCCFPWLHNPAMSERLVRVSVKLL
jgi:hypothetical protein